MRAGHYQRTSFILFVCFLIWSWSSYAQQNSVEAAADYEFLVVANTRAPINLSRIELQRVFTGKMTHLANGQAIYPVFQVASSSAYQGFLVERLYLYPHQLQRIWQQLIFSGRKAKPMYVADDQQMLQYVRQNQGAIGFIRKAKRPELAPSEAHLQFFVWQRG